MAYKVYVQNLGCKVNRYESDAILQLFEAVGFVEVTEPSEADVAIVNTCGVTAEAARKSRQFARRVHRANPAGIVVTMGCQVALEGDEQLEPGDIPDVMLGVYGRGGILRDVQVLMNARADEEGRERPWPHLAPASVASLEDREDPSLFEELGITDRQSESRAYIKIQDGCDYRCAYCTIPLARGMSRSRQVSSILEEAQALVASGYKEAVLTGVEVASFGRDQRGEATQPTLIDLLERLDRESGLARIRLSSLEPRWLTEEVVERLSKLTTLGHHFHLSLQSGSDSVLRRMRRRYTTQIFADVIDRLRRYMPDVQITTDIIVGFPGETDAEHQESLAFAERMGFMRIHVFRYSARPNTEAATMTDPVPPEISRQRAEAMQALSDSLFLKAAGRRIWQSAKVLIESIDTHGATGYTEDYWPVLIPRDDARDLEVQAIVEVELTLPATEHIHAGYQGEVRLIAKLV